MAEDSLLYFVRNGNGVAALKSGWSQPEEAFTWSLDWYSDLVLPVPGGEGDICIELYMYGYCRPPVHPRQRIYTVINGTMMPADALDGDTAIGFRLPRSNVVSGTNINIRLYHPDAISPLSIGQGADTRQLAVAIKRARVFSLPTASPFAPTLRSPLPLERFPFDVAGHDTIRAVTTLTLPELALAFEGLGLNCEFGLFQRRCKVEPLGLLRFAGLPYPQLIDGINSAFEGLSDRENLSCFVDQGRNDWTLLNTKYNFGYHTSSLPSVPAEQVIDEQSRVLKFKRERFLEILATGEKLFIVNRPEGLSAAQALPLLYSLRRWGPACLLMVSSYTGRPAGSVEAFGPHLYCGSFDSIVHGADEQEIAGRDTWLSDSAVTAWTSVGANAYRLWRENRGF